MTRSRTPRSPALRGVRGLLSGTISGLGAVTAHQLAGGESAPVAALAVWPLSVVLCLALVSRRVAPLRLGAAALVAQGVWHGLLAVTVPAGSSMGHQEHAAPMGHVHASSAPVADDSSLGMYLAHGLVALLTALLACGADRTVLGLLARWLRPAVPAGAVSVPVAGRRLPVPSSARPLRSGTPRGPCSLRGPPVALR